MDWVVIENLKLSMHIGCHADERQRQQDILLSCKIGVDINKASQSKDVKDSVCYIAVSELARELLEGQQWVLLEQAGSLFIESVLLNFPNALCVSLVLKKFIVEGVEWTGIQLERTRNTTS